MINVFDRTQIARQRARSARHNGDADFLFRWSMNQIEERLSVIRRAFPTCVQIGARGKGIQKKPFGIEHLYRTDITPALSPNIVCEDDFFPFAHESLNLVVSALSLHTVNDLPGALIQIKKSLKADGVFVGAILGGETLYELRQCLMEAELEISGGISPRVAPFADKQQAGGLLQRAGFALPVIDSEIVTVTYETIVHLMHDLRLMGEANAVTERRKTFSTMRLFTRAGEIYAEKFAESDGRIVASFEVIFMLGWAPHESQQKPLKPGSATTRLADFLGSEEMGTGEKP
jgi:NADH dehydrogenase [ubiquinone] 1 alpha subcomplex assembly factor 5